MRVLLLHNPTAGGGAHARDDLVRAFERASHQVVYQSTKETSWKHRLGASFDVTVAAGGDGTVRRVAIALAELGPHVSVPLAVVPVGTANNIARTLGAGHSLEELAAGLATATLTRLSVGKAVGPWGDGRFVESAGVGVFAEMLHESRTDEARLRKKEAAGRKEDTIAIGAAHLRDALEVVEPRRLRVEADGSDLSGTYLLVEAMNIRSIGPRVDLAPEADHAERSLDLVLAGEAERPLLERYFEWLGEYGGSESPIPVRRVREVRLEWPAGEGHLDDTLWPRYDASQERRGVVTLVIDTLLPVLIPSGG